MKVAFFQPYLANWRIEFLEFFVSKFSGEVIIYDGGFGGKNDTKSVSGNKANFNFKKLKSFSPVIKFKGQSYPFYFSPFLFFQLLKDRPDVIVTEGEINFINNVSIYLYCKVFNKKYIWWSLGKVRTRKKNIINKIFDPIVDFLLNRASCVMARNSLAKDYYINSKGIREDKIIVAPNSMDHYKASKMTNLALVEKLTAKKNALVMLYVGALTEHKRPIDLIHALKEISSRSDVDTPELWFVGDGPEMDTLKEEAEKLQLQQHVTFFGKVFDGVGSYFEASDFVVVPGLGGLVINHAMIFGKPVISRLADGTELDLIIDGETGYLVNGYQQDELVDKIVSILDRNKINSMSVNCIDKVKDDWNIDIMYSRVVECIEFK